MPHLSDEQVDKMVNAPVDRFLRRVTALSAIWAWAFLLPYGIIGRTAIPPLSLIPITASFVVAVYQLTGKATSRRLNAALDALMAAAIIALFVPGVISVTQRRYYSASPLLGAYGLVPSMMNFAIHLYFFLRESSVLGLLNFVASNVFSSSTCPHCQREVLSQWGVLGSSKASSARSSKEGYIAVREVDEDDGAPSSSRVLSAEVYRDARPSTDDESARLV